MEKAIEIKRRAQRCIQNGDLDGALAEYEKLVDSAESDPYNFVLLADLLYKKGEPGEAAERYLTAVAAYEKASLYKNAIAVCKKMLRLSLAPAKVLQALAHLHALDGLAGEASLYHVQYAEYMVRANEPTEAARALRRAFDVCQDNVKVLEQLAEAWLLAGENAHAAATLMEAAQHYRSRSQENDAQRVADRAHMLDANVSEAPVVIAEPPVPVAQASAREPVAFLQDTEIRTGDPMPVDTHVQTPVVPVAADRLDGLDSGRHYNAPPRLSDEFETTHAASTPAAESPAPQATEVDTLPADAFLRAASAAMNETREAAEPERVEPVAAEPELEAPVAEITPATEPEPESQVYEISDADLSLTSDAAGTPEPSPEQVHAIDETPEAGISNDSPDVPGLAFGTPVTAQLEPSTDEMGMADVESLLAKAQEQFRSGDREDASATLAQAAQAYEAIGRFDSAVTIYRSLGRGAHSTPRIMELWLANCEAREDMLEAAQVACELGDASLNQNDAATAKGWFQRAASYDPNNELARRRLQRLDSPGMPAPEPVAQVASVTPTSPEPVAEGGRVEVAVGRGEAVTFDLSGLLAEFQRGVESQLAGDAQSHYDLGMTYREMGLLEQAVDSFRVSEQDPRLTARSLEMIGRCFDDQGRYAEGALEFRRAIDAPGVSADMLDELHLQLATSLARSGDAAGAESELARIGADFDTDPDLAERVAELRRSLGAS